MIILTITISDEPNKEIPQLAARQGATKTAAVPVCTVLTTLSAPGRGPPSVSSVLNWTNTRIQTVQSVSPIAVSSTKAELS